MQLVNSVALKRAAWCELLINCTATGSHLLLAGQIRLTCQKSNNFIRRSAHTGRCVVHTCGFADPELCPAACRVYIARHDVVQCLEQRIEPKNSMNNSYILYGSRLLRVLCRKRLWDGAASGTVRCTQMSRSTQRKIPQKDCYVSFTYSVLDTHAWSAD